MFSSFNSSAGKDASLDAEFVETTQVLLPKTHLEEDIRSTEPTSKSVPDDNQSAVRCLATSFDPRRVNAPLQFPVAETELSDLKPAPSGIKIKTLGWLTCPVSSCDEDVELPSISVFSEAGATEELELVVHSNGDGQAQVSGQRFVSLRSQGSDRPSVASFSDIRIKRAGLYVIEVRSPRDVDISIVADRATNIAPVYASHSTAGDVTLPEELGMGKIQTWGV